MIKVGLFVAYRRDFLVALPNGRIGRGFCRVAKIKTAANSSLVNNMHLSLEDAWQI